MPPVLRLLPIALTVAVILLVLRWSALRSRTRGAGVAAHGHLGVTAALTLLLSGALWGPWGFLSAWTVPAGVPWVRAGGGPLAGQLRLTSQAVDAPTAAVLLAFLVPALWLALVPTLGQVTWPRETGPRRRAGLVSRRWQESVPRRSALLVGVGLAVALAGLACTATAPGSEALRLVVESGPEAQPFSAWSSGQAPGTAVAPWFALGVAALLLALGCVVIAAHRRRALGGLSVEQDLAARRITVDQTARITTALLLWAGLAGIVARIVAGAHQRQAEAFRRIMSEWDIGGLSLDEAVRQAQGLADSDQTSGVMLAVAAVVGLALALLKPYRDLQTLRGGSPVTATAAEAGAARG